MAGEILIQGPLKFIGYLQDYKSGLEGQVLTYSNGNAIWVNAPTSPNEDYDKVITSLIENDAMVNIDGHELTFDETTYVGIDTIPNDQSTESDVAGHIIENSAGTDSVQRENLQFIGATVSDDIPNKRTIVTITQSGLGAFDSVVTSIKDTTPFIFNSGNIILFDKGTA